MGSFARAAQPGGGGARGSGGAAAGSAAAPNGASPCVAETVSDVVCRMGLVQACGAALRKVPQPRRRGGNGSSSGGGRDRGRGGGSYRSDGSGEGTGAEEIDPDVTRAIACAGLLGSVARSDDDPHVVRAALSTLLAAKSRKEPVVCFAVGAALAGFVTRPRPPE